MYNFGGMNSSKTIPKVQFFSSLYKYAHSDLFFYESKCFFYDWSPLSVNNAFYLSNSFNLRFSCPFLITPLAVVAGKTASMLI